MRAVSEINFVLPISWLPRPLKRIYKIELRTTSDHPHFLERVWVGWYRSQETGIIHATNHAESPFLAVNNMFRLVKVRNYTTT